MTWIQGGDTVPIAEAEADHTGTSSGRMPPALGQRPILRQRFPPAPMHDQLDEHTGPEHGADDPRLGEATRAQEPDAKPDPNDGENVAHGKNEAGGWASASSQHQQRAAHDTVHYQTSGR